MLDQSAKAGVQSSILAEDTAAVPGRVGVAVSRESRAVCWAGGKLETPRAAFVSLRKPKGLS